MLRMRLLLLSFYLILSIRRLIRDLLAIQGRRSCNLVWRNQLLGRQVGNNKILLYETLMIQIVLFIRSLVSKIWAISVIKLLLLLSMPRWLYKRPRNRQLRMSILIERWINLTIRFCYWRSCWKTKVFKVLCNKRCYPKQTKTGNQSWILQANCQATKTFRTNPTHSEKT